MGARVSRILRTSEVDHPMHKKGLHRLQNAIDEFTEEVCVFVCVLVIFDAFGCAYRGTIYCVTERHLPDLR